MGCMLCDSICTKVKALGSFFLWKYRILSLALMQRPFFCDIMVVLISYKRTHSLSQSSGWSHLSSFPWITLDINITKTSQYNQIRWSFYISLFCKWCCFGPAGVFRHMTHISTVKKTTISKDRPHVFHARVRYFKCRPQQPRKNRGRRGREAHALRHTLLIRIKVQAL